MIRLLICLFMLALLVSGCGGEEKKAAPPLTVMTEGSTAKDFTLKVADGSTITLSSFKGKPVVLNFWASWCPPCRAEMPVLKDAAGAYEGKVQFIGVNIQDGDGNFRRALSEFGLSYPNGRDEDLAISQAYGVMGLPKTIFINRKGVVSYVHAGKIDEATLASALQKISG